MKKTKYLILGAGISGLSFAKHIDSEDYLIIERDKEAGGYCRTIKRNGYVWDYAGHFFHFSHPEIKENFMDILNSNDIVIRKKNTKIYYKGSYIDYPFQKNIHQLPKEEMIDCLYDLFEKKDSNQYNNFLEMLYGKYGKSITEKFLKPYNEKLYACNLNQLDVDAMGRFFPQADKNEIIRNMKDSNNDSYNNDFIYPKEGAMVFIDKLLRQIENNRIRYNEKVEKIDTDNKIVTTNNNQYAYEYLISSIPLVGFAEMSTDKQINKEKLSYNQVLVFNLGFDQPAINNELHWIYVPSKEINFYRAGFYNNIIGTDKLSMYIEIGYPGNISIDKSEIINQLNMTLANLKRMGIIESHKLVDYSSIVMNPAYVHITQESIQLVEKAKDYYKRKNVHFIGRYSNWKYCSIEDCILDTIDAIRYIKEVK